jgi:hypothetical protein
MWQFLVQTDDLFDRIVRGKKLLFRFGAVVELSIHFNAMREPSGVAAL